MLTRNSSALSKSKMLLALPITLVCVLCFSKNAFSDDKRVKKGNTITYNGNVFELSKEENDTTIVVDPTNGEETMKITVREPRPIKINGKHIYSDYGTDANGFTTITPDINSIGTLNSTSLKQYLLNNMKDVIAKLKDGTYYLDLNYVILNETGAVVYYGYSDLRYRPFRTSTQASNSNQSEVIDEKLKNEFFKKLIQLMKSVPKTKPATVNGKPVNYLILGHAFYDGFNVQDGKITM